MTVLAADFRAVMGRFATGVGIATTCEGTRRAGITVNAFCSVSLDPPLVLVCIDRASYVYDVFTRTRFFAINFLTEDQQALSQCFASRSEYRFSDFCGATTHTATTGAPILDNALAFVDCRVVDIYPGGDHDIFVGHVEALGGADGQPLLFYRGKYTRLEGTPS